jgi:hypothetical protein
METLADFLPYIGGAVLLLVGWLLRGKIAQVGKVREIRKKTRTAADIIEEKKKEAVKDAEDISTAADAGAALDKLRDKARARKRK